jgi:hypothetical protein
MPSAGKRGQKPFRDCDGCDIREAMFARHWVRLKGDSARAVREAGYHGDLRVRAHTLLHRPHVQNAIRRITAEALAKLGLQADDVIREVRAIAFADVRQLFDEEGRLLCVSKIDKDTARAISSIEKSKSGEFTVTFWSKLKALELLMMCIRYNGEPLPRPGSLLQVDFLTEGPKPDGAGRIITEGVNGKEIK